MNWKQQLTKLNPFAKKETPKKAESSAPLVVEPPVKEKQGKHKFLPGHVVDNYKLEESEKQMIVAYWATGLTPSECVEKAKDELNVSVSAAQVVSYSRAEKWQPLIKKIRSETYSDIAAVAGSHKKVRLQRHERVYDKAVKKGDLKHAILATEHQRKEMEGAGDTLSVTLNQFNVLSDEELEFKKKETLEKIRLIESRKVEK